MQFTEILAIPAITVICYLAALAVKATPLESKWLPVVCGVLGGALGAAAMFVMPDYPARDVISAAAVGIISGLAATGADQVVRQLRADK